MTGPAPVRRLSRGDVRIPSSLIENLGSFTWAEMKLLLITLRRSSGPVGAGLKPVTVPDDLWSAWAADSPRAKRYAISGLREKGLLVEGHGRDARFKFERSTWESYARHTSPVAKTRTKGRVFRPKTFKVAAECKAGGCARLQACDGKQSAGQPVAEIAPAPTPATPATPAPVTPTNKTEEVQKVGQPVAKIAAPDPAAAWAETLKTLQEFYAMVDVFYLVRLVAIVRAIYGSVTDAEMAAAVRRAYQEKRKVQRSEGLFFQTVPAALAANRREGGGAQAPPIVSPPVIAAGGLVQRWREVLDGKPGNFGRVLRLLDRIDADAPLSEVAEHFEAVEDAAAAAVAGALSPGELAAAESQAREALQASTARTWRDEPPPAMIAGVRQGLLLRRLGAPRLSDALS